MGRSNCSHMSRCLAVAFAYAALCAMLCAAMPQWSCIATSHNRAGARCPLSLGHDFSENNQFCLDSTAARNHVCKMHGHDSASCKALAQAHGMECNTPRWRFTKGRTSLGQIGARRQLMGGIRSREQIYKAETKRRFEEKFASNKAKNEDYVASLSQDEQEKLRLVGQYCN